MTQPERSDEDIMKEFTRTKHWEGLQKFGLMTSESDVIGGWLLPYLDRCRPVVELAWDQWAQCKIKCEHGEFKGVSDFLNLTEAIGRALVKFQDAEHKPDEDEQT